MPPPPPGIERMQRSPRLPLAQSAFDELEMPVSPVKSQKWINLRFTEFSDDGHLFFANPGARLTPHSLKVPCLYLAKEEKTSFLELYGDRLYAARHAGKPMILPESELNRRIFIRIQTGSLRVGDLTRKGGGTKIHFDAGTLWASSLEYPQKFAEAIYHHPAQVDGIRYKSRHTDEVCLVIWNRRDVAHKDQAPFVPLRSYLRTTDIRSAKLFDEEVLLVGTSKTYDDLMRD